jgi:hypothetical protein
MTRLLVFAHLASVLVLVIFWGVWGGKRNKTYILIVQLCKVDRFKPELNFLLAFQKPNTSVNKLQMKPS